MNDKRPTIEEFKRMFAKTFRFSPYKEYDPEAPYVAGNEVLWLSDSYKWGVYKALTDNTGVVPSDTTAWQEDSGVDLRKFVMDSDIEEAMAEAAAIVPDQCPMIPAEYKQCFLLMTAHFLITDWQATNQGLNASGASGILTSRTVGKMSAGYSVSTLLQQYPQWQALITTWWGLKAMTLLARYNVGNAMGIQGAFTPY